MFKVIKYIYERGRKQAYTEILGRLEVLADTLPRTREGQILRQPINETISELVEKLAEGEAQNVK